MTLTHSEPELRVAALYRFCRLDDYEQLRQPLAAFCCGQGIKGTLLLAREVVAWGPTKQVLTAKNLTTSRQLTEAWDEQAQVCERGEAAGERISA